jgi:hypothetical protein
MKLMWIVGVLAFLVGAAAAAAPAGAAVGGNSANAKLCQRGGWLKLFRESDGSTFANQGECVSYGAQGNTILTEPPNAWKAACEQVGGTFSVGPSGYPAPAYQYVCDSAPQTAYDVLLTICFGYPDAQGFAGQFPDGGPIGTWECLRAGTA